MMQHSQHRWAAFLDSRLHVLLEQNPVFPIKLGRLCSELGVRVSYRKEIGKFQGYIGKTGVDWNEAIIFLHNSMNGTRFERFCIAHELAHLLLLRKFNVKPNSTSEYWYLEALCDRFASLLLVPDAVVEKFAGEMEPKSALRSAFSLSNAAYVPWIQAARRISEVCGQVYYLRVTNSQKGQLRIVATTYPRQKERGRIIPECTAFSKLLRAEMTEPSMGPRHVEPGALQASAVPSFYDAAEGALLVSKNRHVPEAFLVVLH